MKGISRGNYREFSREFSRPASGNTLHDWVRLAMDTPVRGGLFDALMDEIGAAIIAEALTRTGGNRTQAAKLLGISRPTLIARIEKYGLKVGASISHNGADN